MIKRERDEFVKPQILTAAHMCAHGDLLMFNMIIQRINPDQIVQFGT